MNITTAIKCGLVYWGDHADEEHPAYGFAEAARQNMLHNLPHPEKVALPIDLIKPTHLLAQLVDGSYWDYFNLGDDLQTLGMQWTFGELPLLDREKPWEWPDDAVVLLGGYLDWRYAKNPPTKAQTLLVGCHFFLQERHHFTDRKAWLADMVRLQGFPALCRDIATRDFIRSLGIDAEYCGCFTLALPPYSGVRHGQLSIDADHLQLLGFEKRTADSVFGKKNFEGRKPHVAEHLQAIRSAKLIVTSKLHVYLPATAAYAPVILHRPKWTKSDAARFSGHIDGLLYGSGDPRVIEDNQVDNK